MKSTLAITALIILTIATLCYASSGNHQPVYIDCVKTCASNTTLDQPPFYLKLLQWTVKQDCGYHCMQKITHFSMKNNRYIHQYHGKWPFQRVFGIQEPASVVFSFLIGLVHLRYFKIIQSQVPDSYSLNGFYMTISIIGMNAWLWSTVFHTRDTSLTAKLDYFSAGGYILYGLCVLCFTYLLYPWYLGCIMDSIMRITLCCTCHLFIQDVKI